MGQKMQIGIIGAGGIANSVHLPSFSEIQDCQIAAVCDLRAERARAAASRYSIDRMYTSQYEMMEAERGRLDGIAVLVEPDRMYRAASECLKSGFNIMIEKPAGINSYQADSLARLATQMGRICAVAMNRRQIPLVQHVLKMMREITPITQVDGCFVKNNDIAAAWDYASAFVCDIVHAADLVRYMADSEIDTAATVVARHNSPVDNAWSSVMQFQNGVIGTLRSNYQTGGRVHTFEIHGPKASAFINLGFGDAKCEADILYFGGKTIYSLAAEGVGTQNVEHIDGLEIAGGTEYHQYYGYKSEDIDFVRCLRTGDKPLCEIHDAAKSMKMVETLLEKRI